jgi:3-hydroxyacyl-[acyl-carrier-protein] dehydratase
MGKQSGASLPGARYPSTGGKMPGIIGVAGPSPHGYTFPFWSARSLKVMPGNQLGNGRQEMRFNLVDRILEVESGRVIRAVKNLTLGEEYLADHFPSFPVMPGVLMLQTLVEAGAWLLRVTEDYRYSVIVLREAKNVKYGTFMEPGRQLQITVELVGTDGPWATLKGKGEVEGATAVSAKLTVLRYNLRERDPALEDTDQRLVRHWRGLYRLLQGAQSTACTNPGQGT